MSLQRTSELGGESSVGRHEVWILYKSVLLRGGPAGVSFLHTLYVGALRILASLKALLHRQYPMIGDHILPYCETYLGGIRSIQLWITVLSLRFNVCATRRT